MKLNSGALKLYLILTENSTPHSVLTIQIQCTETHIQVVEEEQSSAHLQNSFSRIGITILSQSYQ